MIFDENLNDISNELIKSLKQDKVKLKIVLVLCILLLGILCIYIRKSNILTNTNTALIYKLQQDEQILTIEYSIGYWFLNQPEEINDSILYQFLLDNNAWYPDILLKQAKLESGNYTSNVYKNSCNLYGMKKVGKRQTTQLNSTYNGYGCYTNWCESVLDRMLWDIFRFNNQKPIKEEYLKALSQYAEDENYIAKLR